MKLHEFVRGAIGLVNPELTGLWFKSNGFKSGYGAKQVPSYDDPVEIQLQVQSCSNSTITQADFVNIQGEKKIVYAKGQLYGIDRVRDLGGDLLEFGGRQWLVVQRLEGWEESDWCKVLVTAQLDQPQDEESIIDYDR